MGQTKTKEEVVEEYLRGGGSLRFLSQKYGVSRATLHRWVQEHGKVPRGAKVPEKKAMPEEVKKLQQELREARLEALIYKTMVDVAERDLGIQIRKKRGAK